MAKKNNAKAQIQAGISAAQLRSGKKGSKKGGKKTSGSDSKKTDGKEKSPFKTVQGEVAKGTKIGESVAPELFNGGLDRLTTEYRPQVEDLMARTRAASEAAGTQSPEMALAVARMQAGLGGFTTPEEEAMRARALEGINAQFNAGMRSAAGLNLGRNLRGGVAAANFTPVLTQSIQQRRGLENDIMLQEVAEKARRLTEFSNTVSKRDVDLSAARNAALGREQEVLNTDRDYLRQTNEFNAAQQGKEIAGKIAARGTGIGLLQDEKARRDAENQYKESQALAQSNLNNLLNIMGS